MKSKSSKGATGTTGEPNDDRQSFWSRVFGKSDEPGPLEIELLEAREALDAAQQREASLEEEKHELQRILDACSKVRDDLEARNRMLEARKRELDIELDKQRAVAARATAASRSTSQELATTRKSFDATKERMSRQTSEGARLRAELSTLRTKVAELDGARDRARTLEKEIDALRSQNHDLRNRGQRAQFLEERLGEVSDELEVTRAVMAQLIAVSGAALHRCVGERMQLPLQIAWRSHDQDQFASVGDIAQHLSSLLVSAGLTTSLEIHEHGEQLRVTLTVSDEVSQQGEPCMSFLASSVAAQIANALQRNLSLLEPYSVEGNRVLVQLG